MSEPIDGNVAVAQPVAPVQPAPQPVVSAPEPVAPAPVPQAPVAPAPAMPEPLPVDAAERTRQQFEKLIESNRRLFEENENLRRQREQQSNAARAQQQQPSVNPNDFVEVDPNTGEKMINEQRLRARLEELSNSKSEVEQLKQAFQGYIKANETKEVERQEKETYAAYPELNPQSANFDPTFNRLVRATLTDSFYAQDDYGGRSLSFKEAADAVKAIYPNKNAQPAAVTAEEQAAIAAAAQQAQTVREQGSAQAVSQPRNQVETAQADEAELQNLQYRTRYLNDTNALAERIKHTEHILPRDAQEV